MGRLIFGAAGAVILALLLCSLDHLLSDFSDIPSDASAILEKCAALKIPAGPPSEFKTRKNSDRFDGTAPSLIRNATIWTGAFNGTEIITGDIFLEGGIIKALGNVSHGLIGRTKNLVVHDANGAWVTPGLIDMHSHMGVMSAPVLKGNIDLSTQHTPVASWLRSVDGFNTHDESFRLVLAGGVTSAQILPGSQNAIGGQALVIKTRKTRDRTPSSMVLEPPHSYIGTEFNTSAPPRWRHMKQSCGENLARWGTRMDTMWYFRSAYDKAQKIKEAQDEFCEIAESGMWKNLRSRVFPEDLQWEMLIDVLRGRVKISNHCYEPVDLEGIVRLTNEFKFPLASFHHASEAYLVPEVLKRTYGGTPTIALFASIQRVAREAYRDSVFASRILADDGISVAIKSDHGVLNARYLAFVAQEVHYFGLPWNLALSSITSVPAAALGFDHRIGTIKEGFDADIVLWNSHPLQLGATPQKVWVDGILEMDSVGVQDRSDRRDVPMTPNWDKEIVEEVKWEGLPPLTGRKEAGKVVFRNVAEFWTRNQAGFGSTSKIAKTELGESGTVIVEGGAVKCAGSHSLCMNDVHDASVVVDLHGGAISPGFTSFGTGLGIEEIHVEPSTGDGKALNPLVADIPKLIGDSSGVMRTVDTLKFGTRDALTSHRTGGVTTSTSYLGTTPKTFPAPFVGGLSATFRTGASHALESGAIVKDITALHVSIGRMQSFASLSTQVFALRRLLFMEDGNETSSWFSRAAKGEIPLIIGVQNADAMATLLQLKEEVEGRYGLPMKMSFVGATEAHLLAEEIGNAGVGVILDPPRSFPLTWDSRRTLDGPPITPNTDVVELIAHNVTVGLGIGLYASMAKNARFNMAWAGLESNGKITPEQAYALVSTNFEKLLGLEALEDLVAFDGGNAFEFSSKVVAVLGNGHVDLF